MFGLFSKAAPVREADDAPKQPDVVMLSTGIAVAVVQWNNYIAMEMAMKHPIVGRALHKIASSVQQVKWFAELDPDAETVDHRGKERQIKALNALLRSPNDELTPAMLRYWLALNFAGYGRSPMLVTHQLMDRRMPNGIYTLETKHVRAFQDSRGISTRYEYGSGTAAVEKYPSFASWSRSETESKGFIDMIWRIGLRGFMHKDDGNTPLNSIGLPAQVITSLLVRAIQAAEGHPNARYLVTCGKALNVKQKKLLKEHLEKFGPEGPEAGSVPILEGATDVVIHKLDNDLSDIHSKTPSDDMARIIFGAFGIPPAVAAISSSDGAKFAQNYDGSRTAFWEDTIIPDYVNPIMQGMTRLLCPVGIRISADLDSVPALMAARTAKLKEVEGVTFLTTNEKRELFGWAETTALPQQPAGLAPAPSDGDQGDNEDAQTKTVHHKGLLRRQSW